MSSVADHGDSRCLHATMSADCPDCAAELERAMHGGSNAPIAIAYDGTMGSFWTVVVRVWDAAATAWAGISTCGMIASSEQHAISLVQRNGPWPEGAEFHAFPPGHPLGELVWGPVDA